MNKLSAGGAALMITLAYWAAMFWGFGGWMDDAVFVAVIVGALLWGLFRLLTYRPNYVRGAGTLEEVRQRSHVMSEDDLPLAGPAAPEEKCGNANDHLPRAG